MAELPLYGVGTARTYSGSASTRDFGVDGIQQRTGDAGPDPPATAGGTNCGLGVADGNPPRSQIVPRGTIWPRDGSSRMKTNTRTKPNRISGFDTPILCLNHHEIEERGLDHL